MFLVSFIVCLVLRDHIVYADSPGQNTAQLDEDGTAYETPESVHTPNEQEKKWHDMITKNSTSCEEFVANYTFDPFKLIDVDWRVFYFWSPEHEDPFTLKFSIPSKELTNRFRVELSKEMNSSVDWDDAILFMEASVAFSGLVIKTDTDGLFKIVPSIAFEYYNLPPLLFALKVVEPPGYLAMINCKYRMGYALAPTDKMPNYQQYAEEAKKIGYRNPYGRTHLDFPLDATAPHPEDHPSWHDDDEEDLHMEYLHQMNEGRESTLM